MDKYCSICNIVLTKDNCGSSRFTHGGPCRSCINARSRTKYAANIEVQRKRNLKRTTEWRKANKERNLENARRYKKEHEQECKAKEKKYNRTIKGRFNTLKKHLRKENIVFSDLLWDFHFYLEFIKDSVCHYCLGPLNPAGHALDRLDNNLGHFCYNVIPCCKSCNQKKNNDMTYDEMMLLTPVLREIRKQKEVSGRLNWQ